MPKPFVIAPMVNQAASKPMASSSVGGPDSVCFRRLASSSPYPVPNLTCPKHRRAFGASSKPGALPGLYGCEP
jgi:hypothetical protein